MMFWLVGDLGGATEPRRRAVALALLAVLRRSRDAGARTRPDGARRCAGVDAGRRRDGDAPAAGALVAALATGSAVTLAGAVGFVGFVAPHVIAPAAGNEQRVLLPASVLLGGTLVLRADTVARSVVAPSAAAGRRAHRAARRAAVSLAAGAAMSSVLRLLELAGRR